MRRSIVLLLALIALAGLLVLRLDAPDDDPAAACVGAGRIWDYDEDRCDAVTPAPLPSG